MNETTIRESLITEVKPPVQISWGAVIGGWVLAAGVAWLFYELGAAIGLSVVDPTQNPGAVAKGFSYGAGFWILLTWLVSLFVGGLFAGRLAGRSDRTVGMLNGAAVWGLTTVISIIIGAMGLVNTFQGGASLISGGVSAASGVAQQAMGGGGGGGQGGGGASTALEAQLKQSIADTMAKTGNVPRADINQALSRLDSKTLAAISGELIRGNTDGAKNMLILNTNLNQNEVNSIINGLQSQIPRYRDEAAQVAKQATRYSAAALWVMFISTLIAFGLAIWGGALGANSVPRVYDRRF